MQNTSQIYKSNTICSEKKYETILYKTNGWSELEPGTKIYEPHRRGNGIRKFYYSGTQPCSWGDGYIMLTSGDNVTTMESLYLPTSDRVFFTSYEEACDFLYRQAVKQLLTISRIYCKNKYDLTTEFEKIEADVTINKE